MKTSDRPKAETFWARVDRSGDCWLYRGRSAGPKRQTRETAWILAGNPPPTRDQYICVTCRNQMCLRHLALGPSRRAGTPGVPRDKGVMPPAERIKRGQGHRARGEDHGRGKLSAAQVREIRRSSEPQSVLARRFQVSPATIWQIRNFITWNGRVGLKS